MALDATVAADVLAAVQLIRPYLGESASGAAHAIGEAAGGAGLKVLRWMREKLTGRSEEALADLERDPSDVNEVGVRKQMIKQLEAQPELLTELRELLAEAGVNSHDRMNQVVESGGKGIQIKGNNSRYDIDFS